MRAFGRAYTEATFLTRMTRISRKIEVKIPVIGVILHNTYKLFTVARLVLFHGKHIMSIRFKNQQDIILHGDVLLLELLQI